MVRSGRTADEQQPVRRRCLGQLGRRHEPGCADVTGYGLLGNPFAQRVVDGTGLSPTLLALKTSRPERMASTATPSKPSTPEGPDCSRAEVNPRARPVLVKYERVSRKDRVKIRAGRPDQDLSICGGHSTVTTSSSFREAARRAMNLVLDRADLFQEIEVIDPPVAAYRPTYSCATVRVGTYHLVTVTVE